MYEILSFWEIAWILYSIGSLVVVIVSISFNINKYKSKKSITLDDVVTFGSVTFPSPQAQKLTDIKCGKLQYTDLAEELEDELVKLEIMRDNSEFPDQPDVNFINTRLRNWTMQHLTSEELKKYKDAHFNRVEEG